MYLEHYHLKRKPFGLTPGPDFFWLSEKHKEALATLRYGILGDLGFLLLTGEVGVGKTALIHRLLSSLDSTTLVAHITDPGLGINDFFRLLAVEFGIDTPFNSKGEFLIILEKFLRQADKDQKKVLLIVDEAQRVNSVLLDQIRVLSNIELEDRKLINIFFIGQPEFKTLLLDAANRPIRQRIAIYYHVQPLDEAETGQYIEHRLRIAGAKQKIFKPDAIREIYRISQGFPRAINILCDHALLTAYASGEKTIGAAIVIECDNELNIESEFNFDKPVPTVPPTFAAPKSKIPPGSAQETSSPTLRPPKTWAYPAVVAAGVFLVALAGYYFLWSGPDQRTPTQPVSVPMANRHLDNPAEKASPQAAPQPSEPPRATADPQQETIPHSDSQNQTAGVPQAEAAVPLPPLSTPTPPPETVMAMRDTAPAEEGGTTNDPPMMTGVNALDEAVSEPPPTAAENQTGMDEKQALAQDGIASAEAVGEQFAAEQPPPTELNSDPPGDRPEVAADDQPAAAPPSQQTIARLEPSASPIESAVADPPPAADPEKKAAPSAQRPADQSNAADVDAPKVKAAPASPPAAAGTAPPIAVDAPPTKAVPSASAKPAVAATASLQPEAVQGELSPDEKPQIDDAMENRLRDFLQSYCSTYAAKDLDSFRRFFAPDAVENGKPFESLLPKYQKNFTFIDTIYYRIELQQAAYEDDDDMVKIDGNFFLRWLPPDKQWRENAGKITMSLKEDGSSFIVERLDYQSNRSKAE